MARFYFPLFAAFHFRQRAFCALAILARAPADSVLRHPVEWFEEAEPSRARMAESIRALSDFSCPTIWLRFMAQNCTASDATKKFRFPDSRHTRGIYEGAAGLYQHVRGTQNNSSPRNVLARRFTMRLRENQDNQLRWSHVACEKDCTANEGKNRVSTPRTQMSAFRRRR